MLRLMRVSSTFAPENYWANRPAVDVTECVDRPSKRRCRWCLLGFFWVVGLSNRPDYAPLHSTISPVNRFVP